MTDGAFESTSSPPLLHPHICAESGYSLLLFRCYTLANHFISYTSLVEGRNPMWLSHPITSQRCIEIWLLQRTSEYSELIVILNKPV